MAKNCRDVKHISEAMSEADLEKVVRACISTMDEYNDTMKGASSGLLARVSDTASSVLHEGLLVHGCT